jgi:hypothetical protein
MEILGNIMARNRKTKLNTRSIIAHNLVAKYIITEMFICCSKLYRKMIQEKPEFMKKIGGCVLEYKSLLMVSKIPARIQSCSHLSVA